MDLNYVKNGGIMKKLSKLEEFNKKFNKLTKIKKKAVMQAIEQENYNHFLKNCPVQKSADIFPNDTYIPKKSHTLAHQLIVYNAVLMDKIHSADHYNAYFKIRKQLFSRGLV